jgi:hypothetical protein
VVQLAPESAFRVWGLGFRVWGISSHHVVQLAPESAFRVWGLGFRVWGIVEIIVWPATCEKCMQYTSHPRERA